MNCLPNWTNQSNVYTSVHKQRTKHVLLGFVWLQYFVSQGTMFRRFGSALNQKLDGCIYKLATLNITGNEASIFRVSSPVFSAQTRFARCSVQTKKRRKTHPYSWWPNATKSTTFETNLTKENAKFLDDVVQNRFTLPPSQTPLKIEQFERGEWQPGSFRSGLIARKIGLQPMWTTSGKRILTTALQVVDNHVISYSNNEQFVRERRPFYAFHKFKHLDVLVVGAENADPRNYPLSYLGLFNKANVPPKKKLTRFFITPNAKLAPGTPLTANHFRVGDYVDVFGKTRDYGFQGVIKRWNFKGQLKHGGVTKAHKRPGTIARGRKLMGPLKGKKMAGHMGQERRVLKGLKIWRINTKYNVIWVQGPAVPGANGSWVCIYDSSIVGK